MRAFLVAPVLLAAAASAPAATRHVCPDGSGEYPHLRAAVEAAESGDEIELCAGVFDGPDNLDIVVGPKSLVFRSVAGRDATTIDATQFGGEWDERMPHFCLALDAGTTTRIEGITLANAFSWPRADGGAIRAAGASLTLVDSRIEGLPYPTAAERGAGVFVEGGFLRAEDCEFIENGAALWGGAIYAVGGRAEVERCYFRGNGACAYGGAVCMEDGSLIDCVFDPGGAGPCEYTSGNHVHVTGSATILRCRFNGGWNVDSGGLFTGSRSEVLVDDCVFEDCSADVFGGAAFLYGTVTIRDTIFRRNWGAWMGGSDLFCSGRIVLDHCMFVESGTQRSSIHVGRLCEGPIGTVTVSHCVFVGSGSAATIEVQDGGSLLVENSILAFAASSWAPATPIVCHGAPARVEIRCTDIHGNQGGDWVGCAIGMEGVDGNFSADPLFCSVANEDYSLQADSPCAEENSGGCGLIGARGTGCTPSALENSSWGRIKTLFR